MRYKAILFDMDGVLIDSETLMAKTGVLALRQYGIEAKTEDFAEFVGQDRRRRIDRRIQETDAQAGSAAVRPLDQAPDDRKL